jgi:predicted small secreted protein
MKFFKILILMLTISAGTVGLSACENTWEGAGQDVENVGEEMQY